MAITLFPLLERQRELYDLPAGRERFVRYLSLMTEGEELALPLPIFNPLGKAHVAETLDRLVSIGAEGIAAEALFEANATIAQEWPAARLGLVVADDRGGGWTNRYFLEIEQRLRPDAWLKWGWVVVLFWTSEEQNPELARVRVLEMLSRLALRHRLGPPKTLRDLLRLEAITASFSGAIEPKLDQDELNYTLDVIRCYWDAAADDPTVVLPCLFGDEAARSVGYTPLGLSRMAGIALARSKAVEGIL